MERRGNGGWSVVSGRWKSSVLTVVVRIVRRNKLVESGDGVGFE